MACRRYRESSSSAGVPSRRASTSRAPKILRHSPVPVILVPRAAVDERAGFDTTVTTDWHDDLRAALAMFAPSLTGVEFAWGWAGLYEITPDFNALIGEADTEGFRFLYAAGFSGHGLLQGPAVGEAVRDLYLRQKPVLDVSAFDVKRFRKAFKRTELNIILSCGSRPALIVRKAEAAHIRPGHRDRSADPVLIAPAQANAASAIQPVRQMNIKWSIRTVTNRPQAASQHRPQAASP
jgi:FAD dependent oxidoreductase